MVITLCGSSRFKDEMMEIAAQLTMSNHIVLMPCIFHHADDIELTEEEKIRLDNLHKEKINMSDGIFVVNKEGYIGASTYSEIDWAQRMKKEVYFLVNPNPEEEKLEETSEEETPVSGPTEVEATEVEAIED